MGCGASKMDTEIVELCRERKNLIKAARDSWYSLASTHLAYFQSLLGVQNQLKNFAEESIEISFDDFFSDFHSQEIHESSFGGNGMNLGEVREREEMLDLEDEFGDLAMDCLLGDENLELNEYVEECFSEADAVNDRQDVCPDQREGVWSSGDGQTDINNGEQEETGNEDQESDSISPVSEILAMEEIEILEEESVQQVGKTGSSEIHVVPSDTDESAAKLMPNISAYGLWSLQNVYNEISAAFADIIMHGEDVSRMFGPYQPNIALAKGSSFCNKFSTASSRVASCLDCEMLKRSAHRRLERNNRENNQNEINTTLGSVSLTLEKLCMLESKLYMEIKDEEKLRKDFDNVWRKLTKLSDRGAESSKMDASHGSLKRLTPRITVAISAVERIATRTHRIRDGELHPQLYELIERLHRMWKKMLRAHKKQVNALTVAQANAAIMCSSSDSSLRAIQLLEAAVSKLGKAFFHWTKSHRAFADLLTKWLTKFIPDNASDPGSSSAPELLAICNRWSGTLKKVPAAQVLQALNNFSLLLQLLRLNLHEERHQMVKIEYLSSHHEKVMKKACSESGVDWDEYAVIVEAAADTSSSASIIQSRFSGLHEQYLSLRPIRLKLREAQARQIEVRGELEAAALNLIKQGLAPAFKALETFSLEMSNALGQALVPNEPGSQSQ